MKQKKILKCCVCGRAMSVMYSGPVTSFCVKDFLLYARKGIIIKKNYYRVVQNIDSGEDKSYDFVKAGSRYCQDTCRTNEIVELKITDDPNLYNIQSILAECETSQKVE